MIQDELSIQKPEPSLQLKKPAGFAKQRVKFNQILYSYFVRYDFESCLKLIAQMNQEFGEMHEFANFIQGLIQRMKGQIPLSVETFKKCLAINDKNAEVLKNICKNLFFLGRYKASVEVANEALKYSPGDWEVLFTLGQCYMGQRDFQRAFAQFTKAYEISQNEQTIIQLGRMYTLSENYDQAISIYKNGLEQSLQNVEILTTLGILHLRNGDNSRATEYLEQACEIDSKDAKTLLGLASILQDKSDYDPALQKYRTLQLFNPNSSQLWNNVGMCLYGKKKYIASIACLRKALYFDPFEWIIHYNLGLVHLTTQQYSSAFHFFSSAITLKSDFAQSYMYLGMALNKLNDFQNCCRAFDKAIQLEKDYLIYLNYCIILLQNGQEHRQQAKIMFEQFEKNFSKIDEDTRCNRQDIKLQQNIVAEILNIKK